MRLTHPWGRVLLNQQNLFRRMSYNASMEWQLKMSFSFLDDVATRVSLHDVTETSANNCIGTDRCVPVSTTKSYPPQASPHVAGHSQTRTYSHNLTQSIHRTIRYCTKRHDQYVPFFYHMQIVKYGQLRHSNHNIRDRYSHSPDCQWRSLITQD